MKSLDKQNGISQARLASLIVTAAMLLLGCSPSTTTSPMTTTISTPATETTVDGPIRIGAPYAIAGQTYTPTDQIDYDEVGYASWYGAELSGRPTASGEPFAPTAISGAHRTLPLPSYVEVTRLDTGRTIVVRINDRGPADPNRTIDLSTAAAEQLGIAELGMAAVRIRRTNPVEAERATLRAGRPVPLRIDTPVSLLEILRERAARLPVPAGVAVLAGSSLPTGSGSVPPAAAMPSPASLSAPAATAARSAVPQQYIVQVAAFSSKTRAELLARRLNARVASAGAVHRVRLGPFATMAEAEAAILRARALGQPGAIIQRTP